MLRDRAKQPLGKRFDLRDFHTAVLDQDVLPLDELKQLIDDWIASQLKAPG